ncbi:MAG: hypothetical protein ACK550_16595 [Synechococcaceae cyanobacterium]
MLAFTWTIAGQPSASGGQRARPCRPGNRVQRRRWPVPLVALVALCSGAAPAWAQQRMSFPPFPVPGVQLAQAYPPPASVPPPGQSPSTAPANPANRSTTGCSLSIDQMQKVARGQVLRLGQGDCQMLFNTIR